MLRKPKKKYSQVLATGSRFPPSLWKSGGMVFGRLHDVINRHRLGCFNLGHNPASAQVQRDLAGQLNFLGHEIAVTLAAGDVP